MFRFVAVVCFSALFGLVAPSAIPMWEFLKKEEKTSYIYSLFANEVEEYCLTVPEEKNCSQEMLKVGLKKLKEMNEEELDELDPYQRDAGSLIWDTLMNGYIVRKLPLHKSTTTPKPNSYDDDLSFGVTDDFGSLSEESAKIETFYSVEPPKGFVFVPDTQTGSKFILGVDYIPKYVETQEFRSTTEQPKYLQSNGRPKYSEVKTKKPTNFKQQQAQTELPFENIYPKHAQNGERIEDLEFSRESPKVTLTGPSVVRVYPDGSPVTEHAPTVPQDDDLHQYRLQHIKLPGF